MPVFICLYLDYAIYITITTYLVESFWFLKDTLDYVPCHKTASHLILHDFNTPKDKLSHFLASYLNTSTPMMLTFILLQLHFHEHEYTPNFVCTAIIIQCQVSILHLYHPSSNSFYILVFWLQQSFDPIGSEKSSVLWTFFWSLSVPMLRLLSPPRPKPTLNIQLIMLNMTMHVLLHSCSIIPA